MGSRTTVVTNPEIGPRVLAYLLDLRLNVGLKTKVIVEATQIDEREIRSFLDTEEGTTSPDRKKKIVDLHDTHYGGPLFPGLLKFVSERVDAEFKAGSSAVDALGSDPDAKRRQDASRQLEQCIQSLDIYKRACSNEFFKAGLNGQPQCSYDIACSCMLVLVIEARIEELYTRANERDRASEAVDDQGQWLGRALSALPRDESRRTGLLKHHLLSTQQLWKIESGGIATRLDDLSVCRDTLLKSLLFYSAGTFRSWNLILRVCTLMAHHNPANFHPWSVFAFVGLAIANPHFSRKQNAESTGLNKLFALPGMDLFEKQVYPKLADYLQRDDTKKYKSKFIKEFERLKGGADAPTDFLGLRLEPTSLSVGGPVRHPKAGASRRL